MPSPEQLKIISVPLKESELFVNGVLSGTEILTPKGSTFQRFVISHQVLSEPLSPARAEEVKRLIEEDARNLGITGQDPSELTSQWVGVLRERRGRLERLMNGSASVTVFEAAAVSGA